jgi:hypothetical protein
VPGDRRTGTGGIYHKGPAVSPGSSAMRRLPGAPDGATGAMSYLPGFLGRRQLGTVTCCERAIVSWPPGTE